MASSERNLNQTSNLNQRLMSCMSLLQQLFELVIMCSHFALITSFCTQVRQDITGATQRFGVLVRGKDNRTQMMIDDSYNAEA